MEIMNGLIAFFFAFGILVIVFLLCREIVCWYWKINIRLQLAHELLEEQKTTNTLLRQAQGIKVPEKVLAPSGQEH